MLIGQQSQANVKSAVAQGMLNRVNQITPYGSVTYRNMGDIDIGGQNVPQYEATTRLSPEQQKLYDTRTQVEQGAYDLANKYTGRIADATAKPFSYEGMPAAPVYDEKYRQQQRDAIIARNQPSMDREQEALRTRLANQGIGLGTEAWTAAQEDFSRGANDFKLGADVQAGNSAAQTFQLQDATRKNAIQEAQVLRTQPISEVSTLLGTGQGVQYPQFQNVSPVQVQPTDVMAPYGMQYQGQMAGWQNQQQQQQAMLGGLFGLAGAGLGGWARGGFSGFGKG